MTYTLDVFKNGVFQRTLEATEEQAAIIDFAKAEPQRALQIVALAGTAKTTTLQLLWKYLSVEPTLAVAFNRKNAEDFNAVAPGHVKGSTVNSLGHRTWASAVGKRLVVDTKKNYNLVKARIDAMPRRQQGEAWDCFSDITKTIARAKLSGYVPSGVTGAKSLVTAEAFYDGLEEAPDGWFIDMVDSSLREAIKQSYAGLIDYDDQVYMPTLFGGSFPQFPRVQLDEAQDMSLLNHAMIAKLVGPKAQFTAVGDPWQSIYAFRGAVTSSMKRLREQFDMHEMTLSVSFRCPIEVIKHAQKRVPQMKWPSWAAEGRVATLAEWSSHEIPDGSAIICRNNAPLLSCALALLRSGRGVNLVGTDLGPGLVRTLKRLGDPQMTQEKVHEAIDQWEQEKLRKSRAPDTLADKAECLRVFANFGPTLGAAIAHCEHLFKAQGPIQLLSGHKAKGLEWDTVFHLDPHRIPSPWAKEGEALEQELNVRYVIETRAKRDLLFVTSEGLNGDTP